MIAPGSPPDLISPTAVRRNHRTSGSAAFSLSGRWRKPAAGSVKYYGWRGCLTWVSPAPSAAVNSALLDWARTHDAMIIEDDYDAEFRYDRDPFGALQGLGPGHVAYAGSASKSLAPGLRIGWLCCPPGLAGQVTEAKRAGDLGAPVPEQLALADLMTSGRFDRHLRRCRTRYRSRRDALATALRQHAPRWPGSPPTCTRSPSCQRTPANRTSTPRRDTPLGRPLPARCLPRDACPACPRPGRRQGCLFRVCVRTTGRSR